jgi:peptide/nickel transport system permease protein
VLRKIVRQPSGVFGLIVLVMLLIMALMAPILAPGYANQDIPNRLQSPSLTHPLGTDHLGRDLMQRVVYGARVALQTAVPGVLVALLIGLALGLSAGYFGSWIESAILICTDTLQAFPIVIFALALLALIGPSLGSVIVVIALAFAPGYARVVRAQTLSVKAQPFIEVGRALGVSDLRIMFAHILPNIFAPLLILVAMDLASAITVEAGLSFLGLGVKPPTPSWGVILADGFARIRQSPWPVIVACLALMLTTLGLTLFSEALRDALDPLIVHPIRA